MLTYITKINKFFVFLFLMMIFNSIYNFASESNKVSIGMLLGVTFPSLSSGAFGYGVETHYRILPNLMTGVYYYRYQIGLEISSDPSSLSSKTSNTFYGAESLMDFGGGFGLGLKAGIVKMNSQATATDSVNTVTFDTNRSSFFIGPMMSFDYPIGHFSAGAQVSYLHTFSDSAPKTLNLLATGKVNF